MRDFPMFTTEYGVASLVLKEIPYRQEAYIIIRASEEPEELLKECVSFCRMVGAERIYAKGHACVERYPLHCGIMEMRGDIPVDEEKVKNLWPVTDQTVEKWRSLMNKRLAIVDNAATLERRDEKEILSSGGAYFVHDHGELLGAGWIDHGELKLIAAVQKGAGESVLHTLLSTVPETGIWLQVASTNTAAIRFYERMGLLTTGEISRWYRIQQQTAQN